MITILDSIIINTPRVWGFVCIPTTCPNPPWHTGLAKLVTGHQFVPAWVPGYPGTARRAALPVVCLRVSFHTARYAGTRCTLVVNSSHETGVQNK
eukprot:3074088-Rhodomonas_salina.4